MKKAASTEINLLPGPGRRPKSLIVIISLALVAGALAAGGNCCYRKERQILVNMARVNSDLAVQMETRPARREEMQTLMNMQLAIDELSPLLAELEATRMPFVIILEGIYNLVPPDTRLDQITLGDSHAIICGKCLNNENLAQFLDGLKSLPRYAGLVGMQSQLDQSREGIDFVIEIVLKA